MPHDGVSMSSPALGNLPPQAEGNPQDGQPPAAPAGDTLVNGQALAAVGPLAQLENWQRHLLDLSNFNRLLNFRDGKKNAPVVCHSFAELEDRLADGCEFELLPLGDAEPPGEKEGPAAAGPAPLQGKKTEAELLAEDFGRKRLRLKVPAEECGKRLKGIFREARNALQENGANLLFLAVGFLHWQRTGDSETVYRAPLVLIPVELKRRNGAERFSLRLADDEPRVNTTLLEMLRHEHGIAVPGVLPLPEDDHGLDLPQILAAFRMAVQDQAQWRVEEEGAIGLFSFTKFLMWRDLDEHPDLFLRDPLIANLIRREKGGEPDGAFPAAESLDDCFEPRDTFCPLSADSSQLAAVYAAAAGKSFILNGPPGTGKSQTIANMIAHCLASGKTVLFVAEKAAALEVVRQRLDEIGLDRFCLELHSRKAERSAVRAQLQAAWYAENQAMPKNWDAEADRLAEVRRRLNRHCQALHRERPLGQSLFWGVAKNIGYQGFLQEQQILRWKWSPAEIAAFAAAAYEELCQTVKELQTAAVRIGRPGDHPWREVRSMDWKPMLTQYKTAELLRAALRVYPAYRRATAACQTLLPVRLNAGFEELQRLFNRLCGLLRSTPEVAPGFILDPEGGAADRLLAGMAGAMQENTRLEEQLFARYRSAFLELNLEKLERDFAALDGMGWLRRYLALGRMHKTLASTLKPGSGKLTREQIHADIVQGLACRGKQAWIRENAPGLLALLGGRFAAAPLDSARIGGIKNWTEKYRDTIQKLSGLAGEEDAEKLRLYLAELAGGKKEAVNAAERMEAGLAVWKEAGEEWAAAKRDLANGLKLNNEWFYALERQPGEGLGKQLAVWQDNLDQLEGWCLWLQERNRAGGAGLKPLVARFEEGKIAPEQLFTLFDASFCHEWMLGTMEGDASYASYSLAKLQEDLARFKELDAAYAKLAREAVCARLSERTARAKAEGEPRQISVLGHQLALKRGSMSIRRLLEETGGLVRSLLPCFLMSPMSVAQYLDIRREPFDLVIFDEASQIPTWDAVGVMARGRQVIIAGDPMQLPPTNFFQRQVDSDAADAELAYQDLESVLDDCLAGDLMREVKLKWHYRSRNENLIAFSNRHYYNNRLLTFPGAERSQGVSFRHVAGVYDKAKTRTNPAEAKAVADEVMRRLTDPARCDHSIGVVTFNQAQQELIEDLLDEARKGRRELDRYFDTDQPNQVLIKNLENIQGDERDVILLSVCFGPDATGKISLNFGPLNRIGGERRLNVAVTRAKYETVVFSSLLPEQIDLQRTTATGVKHLRNYLEYAMHGPAALAAVGEAEPADAFPSPFEREVADSLRSAGYVVVPQVGCSGYRIDLGVVNPDDPKHFLLGVEGDGANYQSAKTARDRDRLRAMVLTGLGWRLHRVWSADWFMNRRSALEKIHQALRAAQAEWRSDPSRLAPTSATSASPTIGVDLEKKC